MYTPYPVRRSECFCAEPCATDLASSEPFSSNNLIAASLAFPLAAGVIDYGAGRTIAGFALSVRHVRLTQLRRRSDRWDCIWFCDCDEESAFLRNRMQSRIYCPHSCAILRE